MARSKSGLRVLPSKLPAQESFDDEIDQAPKDELSDGQQENKGPWVRKYIANLSMWFYQGRASEKEKGRPRKDEVNEKSERVSFYIDSAVAKDLSIMIGRRVTNFRDKAEFYRTAAYILLNFYVNRIDTLKDLKERGNMRDILDRMKLERDERDNCHRICREFEADLKSVEFFGPHELSDWISKRCKEMNDNIRQCHREKVIEFYRDAMRRYGIEPNVYLPEEKEEE